MNVRDPKIDCVVCRNCIRAFDVNYDDIRGNVKVLAKREEANGWDNCLFEAECPYCFSKEVYNQMEDARWGETLEEKLIEAYKLENELLRKRLMKQEERITKFEKEIARLRKDNRKLADTVHRLQTPTIENVQQPQEELGDESSPSKQPRVTNTSHGKFPWIG